MTLGYGRRAPAACLSLLLAAALACSLSPGGSQPPSGAPLTQAAATITAAANQIATDSGAATTAARALAATSLPSPTAPAATAAAPTVEPSATAPAIAAATEAASPSTPESSVTTTPAAASGNAVTLDPCSLVQTAEVQALIGVPVGTPKPENGGCVIADAATGISSGLVVFALPSSQIKYFVQQYVMQLTASGVKLDPAANDKLNADAQAGDTVACVNDLAAMALGQTTFKAEKVDGLGSAALWSWNASGKLQAGTLVTAQPGALVGLVLATGLSEKEADAQAALKQIAGRILSGLPANFTVAGLQVAGSGQAIDACSLAGPADVESILGAKAAAGVADQGTCDFKDAATQKLLVRVYAFPAGTAADTHFNNAAEVILAGNAKSQAQVTADLAGGDLVAAVRDLAASGKSAGGRTLDSVDGLGDAGMYFAQTISAIRIGYVLAAKPGVLAGLDMLLKPGDDAATEQAAATLLNRILGSLPPKFTVNGAP